MGLQQKAVGGRKAPDSPPYLLEADREYALSCLSWGLHDAKGHTLAVPLHTEARRRGVLASVSMDDAACNSVRDRACGRVRERFSLSGGVEGVEGVEGVCVRLCERVLLESAYAQRPQAT